MRIKTELANKEFDSSKLAEFKNVWVFCEQRQGKMMPTSFELISEGRKLANELGVNLCGLLLGDNVEVGCNSVLNPGTIIGRNSNIYPTSCVRGVIPEGSIWKTGGIVVKKK